MAAAKRDWEASADVTKTKKKKLETLQDELLAIGAGPPKTPLFDQDKPKPPAEDWRGIPIKELADVKPKTRKALAKIEINNVGALVDFQVKHGTFWLKEMKGVGLEGGTELDTAMIKIWQDNPQAGEAVELEMICTGPKQKALRAIADAKGPVLGKAMNTRLKPTWRLVAVSDKIKTLKTLNEVEG